MNKDERNLKIRNLFHDAKNKIGIMSGYAQCIYVLPKDYDIATMPPERILALYSNAMETSRNIQHNSVLAQALIDELHDLIYAELKINKSKPRLKHSKPSAGTGNSVSPLKKIISYFFKPNPANPTKD